MWRPLTMDMEIDPTEPEAQIKDEDLFRAADSGDSSVFRALSPQQLLRALSLRNEDGRSLLHVATSLGHLEVCLSHNCFPPSFGCWENWRKRKENEISLHIYSRCKVGSNEAIHLLCWMYCSRVFFFFCLGDEFPLCGLLSRFEVSSLLHV